MRPGSWVHAAAAPPHQAFTSDPAGVVSDRKADNTTVGDCTHWCSPGPLEAYTLPLLQAYLARLKPHSSKERGARTRG